MNKPFSWASRARSFGYAIRGLGRFLRTEHNAWIHLGATVLVIFLGFYYSLSGPQWVAILLSVGLVWTAEAVNTCLERITDLVSGKEDPRVAYIKDLAAGAVLIASFMAALVGLLIFLPRMF